MSKGWASHLATFHSSFLSVQSDSKLDERRAKAGKIPNTHSGLRKINVRERSSKKRWVLMPRLRRKWISTAVARRTNSADVTGLQHKRKNFIKLWEKVERDSSTSFIWFPFYTCLWCKNILGRQWNSLTKIYFSKALPRLSGNQTHPDLLVWNKSPSPRSEGRL